MNRESYDMRRKSSRFQNESLVLFQENSLLPERCYKLPKRCFMLVRFGQQFYSLKNNETLDHVTQIDKWEGKSTWKILRGTLILSWHARWGMHCMWLCKAPGHGIPSSFLPYYQRGSKDASLVAKLSTFLLLYYVETSTLWNGFYVRWIHKFECCKTPRTKFHFQKEWNRLDIIQSRKRKW